MEKYWVNNRRETNPNNNHEVHKEGCQYLPLADGTYLGYHSNCKSAINEANKLHNNVDGCAICVADCNKG